jgi:beta-galactosidase GanA
MFSDVVEWDSHSLFINQQRIFILSAEFHPWRQPNPDLWPDIFDKIKDNGFNTVSFYTHWALHMPVNGSIDAAEGTYRDNERFIQAAKDAGLWLIARFVIQTKREHRFTLILN